MYNWLNIINANKLAKFEFVISLINSYAELFSIWKAYPKLLLLLQTTHSRLLIYSGWLKFLACARALISKYIFNRPGVAVAVLQTPSSLIN